MLDLDADFLAFLAKEVVNFGYKAAGNHVEVGVHGCGRPYRAFCKDRCLDRAPAHFNFCCLAVIECDSGLDRELQVVGHTLFGIFAVEFASDFVLLQLDRGRWLKRGVFYGLPVELDIGAALSVTPRPSKLIAKITRLNLRAEPSLRYRAANSCALGGCGESLADFDFAGLAIFLLFDHSCCQLRTDSSVLSSCAS